MIHLSAVSDLIIFSLFISSAVLAWLWTLAIILSGARRSLALLLLLCGVWTCSAGLSVAGYTDLALSWLLPLLVGIGPALYQVLLGTIGLKMSRWHFGFPVLLALLLQFPGAISGAPWPLLPKLSSILYSGLFLFRIKRLFAAPEKFSPEITRTILPFSMLILGALATGLFGMLTGSALLKTVSALMLPALIFYLFLISQSQQDLWTHLTSEIRRRYEKSHLKSADVEELLRRLQRAMDEKLYLDEDLNLQKLAQELSLSGHQLSELLNQHQNKSFNQYINEYRIKEARQLLLEAPDRSILSVAHAAGFNSKSAFNRVFLKLVGMTPVQFRQNYSAAISRS